MATVKIQSTIDGKIHEFDTLDTGLRKLNGAHPQGEKFNKPLLDTPSRRTFKEANAILERNGYRLYRENMPTGMPVPTQQRPPVPTAIQKPEVKIEVKEVKPVTEPKSETHEAEESRVMIQLLASHLQNFMKTNGSVNKEELREEVKNELKKATKELDDLLAKFSKDTNENFETLVSFVNYSKDKFKEIEEAIKQTTKEIVVKTDRTTKNVGRQHYQFEILLKTIAAGVNALLVGPAGSGKTSAGHSAAKALDIPFYSISVGMQTTKTEFFGYMDATGKYVRTLFREAFEKGGVFLIDEMDAGNANVITAINQALANGYCAFPDGMIDKHKDFVIIASANTYGTGANREYVGRNQLDAATLDRFATIDWMYDEGLENDLCDNKDWLKFVRKCRANADKHKIRTVVSPRASIFGSQLLAGGMKRQDVEKLMIFKGLNETERAKLVEF